MAFDRLKSSFGSKAASCDKPCALPSLSIRCLNILILTLVDIQSEAILEVLIRFCEDEGRGFAKSYVPSHLIHVTNSVPPSNIGTSPSITNQLQDVHSLPTPPTQHPPQNLHPLPPPPSPIRQHNQHIHTLPPLNFPPTPRASLSTATHVSYLSSTRYIFIFII